MALFNNDRLIRAIQRQPLDRTPVWIMRQAGRYLPEYRKIRAAAGSFMRLCQTPELACEVTLQPLRRYPLDAAIIFSDILTIPDALGLGLSFKEGEGPQFSQSIKTAADLNRLSTLDLSQLAYVYEAIRLVKQELAGQVPLIGFCGAPWTLAAYMTEGKSVPGFPTILTLLKSDPQLLHGLLNLLAKSVEAHLRGQIEAGADVVMIFDTWGGLLDLQAYESFSLSYIKSIINGLKRNVYNNRKIPVILFTKGGNSFLEVLAETGCDVLGVDWETSLQEARLRVGAKVALQGNLHPGVLLEDTATIRKAVHEVMQSYGVGSGHIFNLGHGITPNVPPAHLAILIDAVHEVSRDYHQNQMMNERV